MTQSSSIIFSKNILSDNPLRQKLDAIYRFDETACLEQLVDKASFSNDALLRIEETAMQLISGMRERRRQRGGLDSFMQRYDLSSEQGIALMCLAEALLRVPDKETINDLIQDKLSSVDWESQLGSGGSVFVNAATWGLMMTGNLFKGRQQKQLQTVLRQWFGKVGEPVARAVIAEAMKILSKQFVIGETIEEALERSKKGIRKGYRYSYDMLGEAARTAKDAVRYFQAYEHAIHTVGKTAVGQGPLKGPGVSVKLSALHPRYEVSKREMMLNILIERLTKLTLLAKQYEINLTIDAEEADRLDLSLDVIEAVFTNPQLKGWEGFGLAIQAYQKRTFYLIDWLEELALSQNSRLIIRLVKGAYWDYEIKDSQVKGLESYPVFTRKVNTDVSYLACAKKMIDAGKAFYPQFATHNAYTVAAILEMIGDREDFEFQRLKGMGGVLHDQLIEEWHFASRMYAPVGEHRDLLAYLVRRLLENGANTSFVHRLADENSPIAELVHNPLKKAQSYELTPHPNIPLPKNLYGESRANSSGFDLSNYFALQQMMDEMRALARHRWQAAPLHKAAHETKPIHNPAHRNEVVGYVLESTADDVEIALKRAAAIADDWDRISVHERANYLEKAARLLEQNRLELMTLLIREGGKTITDALNEVREAIDFCYYYASQARQILSPQKLPGPTGELNILQMHGRGVAVCISPWNFPLAIFTGQVMAALVAGNCVIAKPSEQTSLIAARAVQLFYEAGIPEGVLQLLPGRGSVIGATLIADARVKLVIFTGSTETARFINQTLANRSGEIIPFVAETGGQNAMIADSTTLAEQLVNDVIASAFGSAGQRCSALRVLYLHEEIADHVITMLQGAMAEIIVGDPRLFATDVGPVIDEKAKAMLQEHVEYLNQIGKLIYQVQLPASHQVDSFFAPCAYEIEKISVLKREVFGPILHIIRYKREQLDEIISDINSTGYGLTFGIHSRLKSFAEYVQKQIHAGNVYINRNMIGAVVGVQPFGGEGLSGTGSKAGGPHYLQRLCHERTYTVNTTAAGGNASLLALAE